MSNQIADGLKNLTLNSPDEPTFSPFPKLVNPPANVPPSDTELEATLENARTLVLNSNDPEMQLAWAADALVYVGVCADNEERLAAAKPHSSRPATPRIEHGLRVDAMNIVTFLAEQHHPKAEFLKGMWLEWGRFGQREDKKEAFRCYSRAADRGYARAEYRIGMLYESYNDPAKALRHYHRGVEAGDAASCYRLGMMTLRGQHGQQQDYGKAVDLIRKSASKADENAAQGAYVYGMLLARQLPQINIPESILAPDEQQARVNIEKAAYLKFAKAQLKMGSAYELASLGCEFNPALSMHYNALAAKQGEAEADMALSKWFLVGSEGLFPKNEELAYTYAERAAQNSLATAEFALGYFNEIGVYVPVNLDKALEWYHKAAKHGNADATARVDALSKKQTLSRRDHEQVAVSRIKSQHGSMRGARPERLRQQTPRLSKLSETSEPQPSRGRTPYPDDSRPAVMPDIRAASSTPYPLDDGPPRPIPQTYNTFQQPPRPATVLNAEVRPNSAYQNRRPVSSSGAPPQHGGPVLFAGQSLDSAARPSGPATRPAQPQHASSLPPASAAKPPPRIGSMPATASRPSTSGGRPAQRPPMPPVPKPGAGMGLQPAATAPAKTSAAARPPGKGPKTFDEMGVPATKQDSDCVVM
ncbi:hypothetical protein BDY17DRAFT_254120 [Neohortaea acidophila]|uniref:HCP-like protein n=1 Tax=Neohortaea acidophila TaxID=245834 RepID=A0A6A6PNS4_9PEZI|nr:uncharacterized protein BDY17DRAFT_254120 [Neohortaea acidophila]KAF2481555.1 hypothetical protein BDY17DRAFT_254120 [Neohortaea acidophila]